MDWTAIKVCNSKRPVVRNYQRVLTVLRGYVFREEVIRVMFL